MAPQCVTLTQTEKPHSLVCCLASTADQFFLLRVQAILSNREGCFLSLVLSGLIPAGCGETGPHLSTAEAPWALSFTHAHTYHAQPLLGPLPTVTPMS